MLKTLQYEQFNRKNKYLYEEKKNKLNGSKKKKKIKICSSKSKTIPESYYKILIMVNISNCLVLLFLEIPNQKEKSTDIPLSKKAGNEY